MRYNRKTHQNCFLRRQVFAKSQETVQYQTYFLDGNYVLEQLPRLNNTYQRYRFYNEADENSDATKGEHAIQQQKVKMCDIAIKYIQQHRRQPDYTRTNFERTKRSTRGNSVYDEFLNYSG